MTKKMVFLLLLAFCLFSISAVSAQDPVRVKCGNFTMNVPSARAGCYQIDANIPVSDTASPEEIAGAQTACTSIYFTDYETLQSRIQPQVTFYQTDDLSKTSFELLDVSMSLSNVVNNINAGFAAASDLINEIPFLPYQASERTGICLPLSLDFEKGTGVRFVTTFDETISAITGNSNLYYSFQGLSSDGKYYISAVFPLRSSVLNGRSAAEIDWNSVSAADLQPSLDELDYYIRSIVIE